MAEEPHLETTSCHGVPVHSIAIPECRLTETTDWLTVGRKLDQLISIRFRPGPVAIRGIGTVDHPGRTLDELAEVICSMGTDKYDDRPGLHYGRSGTTDIHAGPHLITPEGLTAEKYMDGSPMAECVALFYEGAIADRGYPVRLELLMVYDLDQLAPMSGLLPMSCYQFAFKDETEIRSALLGVVKVL